jgi:FtsX-like permease family
LQIRTSLPPEAIRKNVEQQIHNLEAELPVYGVETMEHSLGGSNGFFLIRMGALFALILGLLGLILAIVGVYGVVSYAASRRTHDIGIRMALGADPRAILRLILRSAVFLLLFGVSTCLKPANHQLRRRFGMTRLQQHKMSPLATQQERVKSSGWCYRCREIQTLSFESHFAVPPLVEGVRY